MRRGAGVDHRRGTELLGGLRDLDAGVVNEDVEAAEALPRLADHVYDVVLAGDVTLDEDIADVVLLDLVQAGTHLLLGPGCLVGRSEVVDRDVGKPCSAKRTAIACPIPELPPVTRTFLPLRPGISPRRGCRSTAGAGCDMFLLASRRLECGTE